MNLCLEMIQVQLRLIRAIFKIKFEKTQVEQSRIPGAASGLFLTRSVITGEVIICLGIIIIIVITGEVVINFYYL